MIRLATIEDKEEILELANYHIEHVGRLLQKNPDPESVDALANHILTDDNSACLVYVKDGKIIGLIAGFIDTPTLSKERFFNECLFVFKPGKGAYSIPLIKAVKQFVIDAELDGLIMGCMSDADERLFSLYKKLELDELERKYLWKPTQSKS